MAAVTPKAAHGMHRRNVKFVISEDAVDGLIMVFGVDSMRHMFKRMERIMKLLAHGTSFIVKQFFPVALV